MIVLIEWSCRIVEMIVALTIGALLMYWWMSRRLDRSITDERRCADARLMEQSRRSSRSLNQLASDYSSAMTDLREAVFVCERLATERQSLMGDIAQLSAENDTLRHRLAQTPAIVNTWRPKTERGQA